jgi:acylpyruvate hydrolase
LLHPVQPRKILAIGLNYRSHADESELEVPAVPVVFAKWPSSLIGPEQPIVIPREETRPDFEGELGVVIGAGGRYIKAGDAMAAVAGFVVLNDATAREWQRAATQWTAGKNFEGSMPIGPELVTPDEVDISDVALTTTLNGQVMQSAKTSQMIVDVPSAIEFFSSFTRLRPGDVIATGTPGGVGFARKPPVFLQPDDVIEVTVEGVGTIRNRVVAEDVDLDGWRWRPEGQPPPGF